MDGVCDRGGYRCQADLRDPAHTQRIAFVGRLEESGFEPRRHVLDRGDDVVGEGWVPEDTARIDRVFVQGVAQPLRKPALALAGRAERIDRLSSVDIVLDGL